MYWHKNSRDITFKSQVRFPSPACMLIHAHFSYVVGRLASSSCIPQEDICVTICVGEVSKITCSGNPSEDGLIVTWNHPFLLWVLLLKHLCLLSLSPIALHLPPLLFRLLHGFFQRSLPFSGESNHLAII